MKRGGRIFKRFNSELGQFLCSICFVLYFYFLFFVSPALVLFCLGLFCLRPRLKIRVKWLSDFIGEGYLLSNGLFYQRKVHRRSLFVQLAKKRVNELNSDFIALLLMSCMICHGRQ